MKKLIYLLLLMCCYNLAVAEDTLSLEKAIETALEKNNLLKVSQDQTEIASRNATLGNAGFMPTVNLNAGGTIAQVDIKQKVLSTSSGTVTEIQRNGVKSTNLLGNVTLNWTLFNGFKNFNSYDRLKETYRQANAQTKVDIENTVANVSATYFEVQRQQEITQAYQNNLVLFEDRLKLADARLLNGYGAKSDVLLSKVDINTQRSLLLQQRVNEKNARVNLSRLLNQSADTVFYVSKKHNSPELDSNVSYSGKTTSLITTEKGVSIAKKQYKESNGNYYPQLNLVTAYNFTQSTIPAGQQQFNQNIGPNIGLLFTWSLFDGMNKNRVRDVARINIDVNEHLHKENQRTQSAAFESALAQYQSALQVLRLQTESYTYAIESNVIARERYQAGRINLFEYKETQNALEDSRIRLANARYQALVSEVELKRLNGDLIK